MGIIMGALGGAGAAMQDVGSTMLKAGLQRDTELEVSKVRSDLELQRQKTIAAYQDELKNAPLNRLGATAKRFAGEQVPVEAEPVTNASGVYEDDQGNVRRTGMTGNYAGLIARARKLPPEDQQAYLDQIQRQKESDTAAAEGQVQGKTRARTSDEAMKAAAEDAKVNDLPAYAAYEAQVGKPARDERRIDTTEKKVDQAARAAELKDQRDRELAAQRDATQRYIAELRDETANRRLETLVSKLGGGSNGIKEALSFIDGARKELANDAATLKSMYASEIKDLGPAQRAKVKAEYDPKFAAIDAKRNQIEADFNALREKVGLPGAPIASPPPAPAPTPVPPRKSAATRPPLSSFQR